MVKFSENKNNLRFISMHQDVGTYVELPEFSGVSLVCFMEKEGGYLVRRASAKCFEEDEMHPHHLVLKNKALGVFVRVPELKDAYKVRVTSNKDGSLFIEPIKKRRFLHDG